jgi:hypothetical protein
VERRYSRLTPECTFKVAQLHVHQLAAGICAHRTDERVDGLSREFPQHVCRSQ